MEIADMGRRYTREFKVGLVERMLAGENVSALSRDNAVPRSVLYAWKAAYQARGLNQATDTGEIEPVIDEIIAGNPDTVAEFQFGKDKLIGWFVGQVMQRTKGKANPHMVNQLLQAKLKG